MYEFSTAAELRNHYAGVTRRLNSPPQAKPQVQPAPSPKPPPPDDPQARKALNPVRTIIHAAALHSGFDVFDILSHRHRADVVRIRHIAMFLAYKLTSMSFPQIGRQFEHRDHTTILHAVRKIERLIKVDEAMAASVAAVRAIAISADPALGRRPW